ncbi:MAG: ATP-binding protein [Erysipelotrichaceae bacterium]|uniref:ATP-binding protein n=1 Tax=Anaerorhabdus sp. TaxID=1872524 RepID=UPI002FC8427A
MKPITNYPNASILIESMRSVGYTFETALCDIIDNSIYAKAKNIIIECNPNKNDYLGILDDGIGMNKNELFEAMRYGSKNPTEFRNEGDLGRFGLGLKSASLSQCKKLIVITKKDNCISSFSWDLDYIKENNDWNLLEYDINDLLDLPMIDNLNKIESGTLVLWKELDRIENTSEDISNTLSRLLMNAEERISLVFHRIVNENKIKILINGNEVVPLDPFLENNSLTQVKREECLKINDEKIKVKPFILPPANKLSLGDFKKIGGKNSLKSEQGFYVYRNKRLIIWGTWFKMMNASELNRLARVRVDIPNTLDYIWNIDIKKSQAILPDKVKRALVAFVLETTNISQEVHEYRGKRLGSKDIVHIWEILKKDDVISFEINTNSPEISKFTETLDKEQLKIFNNIIQDIVRCVPTDAIFACLAKNQKIENYETEDNEKDLLERIERIKNESIERNLNYRAILRSLKKIEPYSMSKNVLEVIEKIITEEYDDRK